MEITVLYYCAFLYHKSTLSTRTYIIIQLNQPVFSHENITGTDKLVWTPSIVLQNVKGKPERESEDDRMN